MEKDYKLIATNILKELGGAGNVQSASNCITRLRIILKNPSLLQLENLKKTNSVMQVISDGKIVQVVLGPSLVKKVAEQFYPLLKEAPTTTKTKTEKTIVNPDASKLNLSSNWRENKAKVKEKQKRFKWLSRGLRHLANIFSPLIPAVIAAGMFAALASIVKQFGANNDIATANQTVKVFYYLFNAFSTGFTSYLLLATGYNAGKEFGATPMLGLMLGGICLAADITNLAVEIGLGDGSLNSILRAGKGGVIGVIAAVWLLSIVEKFLQKKIKSSVSLVLVPFISILLVGCVYVFGIMIVAGYISDGIVWIITNLTLNSHIAVRLIAGFIGAALFLPLVMTGMHWALIGFYETEKAARGCITLYPVLAMAGAGQVGAAIALYIKARKKKNTTLLTNIKASVLPGILGVGEPLVYSVTLPLGTPFITAGLGAGIGGAFVMAMGVASTAYGPSGLVALPLMCYLYQDGQYVVSGLAYLYYVLGLLMSAIGGFIATYFLIKDKKVEPQTDEPSAAL
ncbi:MAG: PTS transporter subunit EIIC [Bacilli bacterium]|nr:PTS transporter subunit EIIC [Bacilli bacterium]